MTDAFIERVFAFTLSDVNNSEILQIATEIETAGPRRELGRFFALSRVSFAIDLGLRDGQYLFVSAEPAEPRTYLIRRRSKDLEKLSTNPSPFLLALRKRFSHARIERISKRDRERVLTLDLITTTDAGEKENFSLIFQLTGRSANIFVVDHHGLILDRLRDTKNEGQTIGTIYGPPSRSGTSIDEPPSAVLPEGKTLSESLDEYYLARGSEARFQNLAEAARKKIRGETTKRQKLRERLRDDLKGHGNADQWKRFGDLLLANAANARREGDRIFVTDYYHDAAPEIDIEGDRNLSISEVAERYFKRYTKARNAAGEIARRMTEIDSELANLERQSERLEKAIFDSDESFFAASVDDKRPPEKTKKRKAEFNGARSFVSSDGYEILVGKKAKDNDYLTFRVARSLDLWLHAADYPGSHVVVRTPDRREVPHRTLVEAAQLAAFYSDARRQPKAAVNYTQKKFVNKPRGSAPGLVRLASFKTVLVVPGVPEIKNAA